MILSDVDIHKFIKDGDIRIDPLDVSLIKPGSYTFKLGSKLFIPRTKGVIDIKTSEIEYEEIEIPNEGYIIQPGEFLLGQTLEKLTISQKIACFIDNKTSLARIGLNVILGSTFIEPGQTDSHETLEISNISKNPIRIYAKMKVVKGIFFLLNTKAEIDYLKVGTYAKQVKPHVKLKKTFSKH